MPPLIGSLSTSIEFRSLIADRVADSRFRCSGGRLRGCVSGSIFFLREEKLGSVAWRAKLRGGRGCGDLIASRDEGESGRTAALLEGEREAGPEGLVGNLVGDPEAAGDEGACDCCCCGCSCGGSSAASSSSSSTELGFLELFLEKNFIEVDWAGLKGV